MGNRTYVKCSIIIFFLVVLFFSIGFVLYLLYYSEDVPYIEHDRNAEWIMYPHKPGTVSRVININDIKPVYFVKQFFISSKMKRKIIIHIKSLRSFSIKINGESVAQSLPYNSWKRPILLDISTYIRDGRNIIEVEVKNPFGPPLLYLYADGLAPTLKTDSTWLSGLEYRKGDYVNVVRAVDTVISEEAKKTITTIESVYKKRHTIIIIFLLSIIAYLYGQRLYERVRPKLPFFICIFLNLLWISFFFYKVIGIPLQFGFDGQHHIEYVSRMIEENRVPLAHEGTLFFHPPFFYMIASWFVKMARILSLNPVFALKLIPFLCGVGHIWLTYLCAKKIFGNDWAKISISILFVGIMPMNIYMSSYISNEPLHAFLVSLAIFVAVHIFYNEKTNKKHMLFLGSILGFALLTKVTILTAIPLFIFFTGVKVFYMERKGSRQTVIYVMFLFLPIFIITFWYFFRNYLYYGRFILTSWHLPWFYWWQDQGFHTVSYYLKFGQSLIRPYFSGFYSFWDALYSTFWGDGLISGMPSAEMMRFIPWNWDFMTSIYLISLPATAVFFFGMGRSALVFLKGNESTKINVSFHTLYLYVICFAVFYGTLIVPVYAQAKATYGLCATIPIAIIFAYGFSGILDLFSKKGFSFLKPLFFGWFGLFITSIALSFLG